MKKINVIAVIVVIVGVGCYIVGHIGDFLPSQAPASPADTTYSQQGEQADTYQAENDADFIVLDGELPMDLNRRLGQGIVSSLTITEINYEVNERYIEFEFKGEKTFDYRGEDNADESMFAYRLLDEEGFVLKSGTFFTSSIKVGEKFKDVDTIYISDIDIDPNATYVLELSDYD